MELRWTQAAASDLETISNYLYEKTPAHAAQIVQAIYESVSSLLQFPHRGRSGRIISTRELVLPNLPYLIVYSVDDELIHIVRILHGAQKWP
jgi:toxin ParE1/3/4